jgi:hypothetical protein
VVPETPKHTREQWFYLFFLVAAVLLISLLSDEFSYPAFAVLFVITFGAEIIGLRLRWEGLVPGWLMLVLVTAISLYFDYGARPALAAVAGGLALVPVTWLAHRVRDKKHDAELFAEVRAAPIAKLDPRGDYGWDQLAEAVFVPRALTWDPAICEHNRRVAVQARKWLLERGVDKQVEIEVAQILSMFIAGARDHTAIDAKLFGKAALRLRELLRTRGR